jgi:hypothetical protein
VQLGDILFIHPSIPPPPSPSAKLTHLQTAILIHIPTIAILHPLQEPIATETGGVVADLAIVVGEGGHPLLAGVVLQFLAGGAGAGAAAGAGLVECLLEVG